MSGAGKYGEGYDGVIFRNIEDVLLYFGFSSDEEIKGDVFVVFDKRQVKSASKNNGMYSQATGNVFKQSANPVLAQEEQLRQDFKQKIIDAHRPEEEAEQLSHIYIATNRYFSKYSGIPLDKIIQADNLSAEVVPSTEGNRGKSLFYREKTDIFGNIIQEAKTILQLTNEADKSTALHELGHIFLNKFRRLAASGMLKGRANQDWQTLVKALKLEGIDFSQELSVEDKRTLSNAHEEFAVSFEKYLMTGKAPTSKLKHVFEAFKRWLTDIYHSIRDLMYEGSDGQLHTFELSPKVREVFDSMLSVDSSQKKHTLGKQETIRDVLNIIQTEQGRKSAGSIWVDYARVSPEEAKRISEATGLNINTWYIHTLSGEAITHTLNRHGIGNEQRKDQLPITEADFERIPDIIKNPDEISIGIERVTGGNNDTIVYKKRINGHILIVEEVRTRRGKLAFHTMRKTKAGYDYDLSKEGHPIVKEKAKSQRITSDNEATPNVQLPHALSSNDSLHSDTDTINSDTTESYNQIIGIGGARKLDESEGVTTRMDNLKIARQMERKGLDTKKIWLATGWMRGTERKWRYEIMDGRLITRHRFNQKLQDEYEALIEKSSNYDSESAEREIEMIQQMSPEELKAYIEATQNSSEDNDSDFDISMLTPEEQERYKELEKYIEPSLSDIFDAPELFRAYPELKKVMVLEVPPSNN